jgi:hypothetical protein
MLTEAMMHSGIKVEKSTLILFLSYQKQLCNFELQNLNKNYFKNSLGLM